ncbi:MAG: alpha/beta fold hydrolase [Oryzihumus sp.]
MSEPTTHTLDAPGALLHYDVRGNDSSNAPVLLLIGSPMTASGFVTLAGHFTDRTVVTYDPRGAGRSRRTDDATETTPEEHADDLHRLLSALGSGPVDLFATSGGAVNALVLVARHPEQVRTLVAHEPPAAQVLPDREEALAAAVDIHQTYERSGLGPAMAKFITLVGLQGPVPADFADRPAPDPASFGLPSEDDGTRDDPLVGQNMVSCLPTSTTSTRSAQHRPASSSPPAPGPRASWPTAPPWPSPNGSGHHPSPSPATTPGSSAASTA